MITITNSKTNERVSTTTNGGGFYSFSSISRNIIYHITAGSYDNIETKSVVVKGFSNRCTVNFTLSNCVASPLQSIDGYIFSRLTSNPINNAKIDLYSVDNKMELVATTLTNSHGKFLISGLECGKYKINCSSLDFRDCGDIFFFVGNQCAATQYDNFIFSYSTSHNVAEKCTYNLYNNSNNIHSIDIALLPAPLNSAPSNSNIYGKITDIENNPVEFAHVILFKVNGDGSSSPISSTNCDVNGCYIFHDVPYGEYFIQSNKAELFNID